MDRKTFAVEIKSVADDGAVSAYVATYRTTPDTDNDIIAPGAFTKSLAGSPKIPMLWQHDTKSPCGHWYKYDSDSTGILATGKFNLATDWGRNAYGAVKGGDVSSFSIGYLTERATYDTKGVRHLMELNLKEASPVTFAADDAAQLVSVKSSFTAEERRQLAKEGVAMPDGSFPIRNSTDLENAIHDIGRANDPAAAKAHIRKRAAALGLESALPDDWKNFSATLELAIGFLAETKAGRRHSEADGARMQAVHDLLHGAHEQVKALGVGCADGDYEGDGVPMGGDYYSTPKSNLIPISAKELAEAVAKAIIGGNPKTSDKE